MKPEDGPAEVLDKKDTEQKDKPGPKAGGSPAKQQPAQVPQHTPTPTATPEPQEKPMPLDDMPKQPKPENASGQDQNKADDAPEQGGGNHGGSEGGDKKK